MGRPCSTMAPMPETQEASLVLHYAPRTRALTALWLLEELGVPYRLEVFDIHSGRQRQADYLALNPMGKVPTLVDAGVAIAEMGAIAIYLCDKHPAAGLAPAITDPRRGDYLRWMFFAAGVMEPAFAEKLGGWEPKPGQHAWGSFARMHGALTKGLEGRPFLLGDRFSACDVTVGAMTRFGLRFGAFEKDGSLAAYVARLETRDAFVRALAIEAREGERLPMKPRT